MNSLLLNWRSTGREIRFDYNGLEIFFRFPYGSVELPAPRVLRLCEWLMLSPWHDVPLEDDPAAPTAEPKLSDVALCFSAGVDSAAALQLLPGCEPIYVERAGIPGGRLNQSAHLKFCDEIAALRIETNFELMRTTHGLAVGYSTGRGMAVPAILHAAIAGRTGIAYGAVLDDNHFPHGIYRPFTKDYHARQDRFRAAGFTCLEPTRGCSEVITCHIVDRGPYRDLARSCLRGTVDEACGRCYKCFRKSLILGRVMDPPASVLAAIKKDPPKMGGPLIWAAQRYGFESGLLDYASDMDVDFLSRFNAEITHDMPKSIATKVVHLLRREYKIEPMTREDVETMKAADFRRSSYE